MSFAAQTKKELTMIEAAPCCERAELSALIRMNGTVQVSNRQDRAGRLDRERGDRPAHLHPAQAAVRRSGRAAGAQKNAAEEKQRVHRPCSGSRWRSCCRSLPSSRKGSCSRQGIDKSIVRKAVLQAGLFARRVSWPAVRSTIRKVRLTTWKSLRCTRSIAGRWCELANKYRLNARCIERKKGFIFYIKEGEKIIELLNIIGAHQALFKFEDVRIMRDMRNSVNRIVNCETANLNKTIGAAVRQIDNIRLLQKEIGLENLPEKLREVAEMRLRIRT